MPKENKEGVKGWIKIIRYLFFLNTIISYLNLRNYTYYEYDFYYYLVSMILNITIFGLLGEKSKWGIYLARGFLSIQIIFSLIGIGMILFIESSLIFSAVVISGTIRTIIMITVLIYLFTSRQVKQTYF